MGRQRARLWRSGSADNYAPTKNERPRTKRIATQRPKTKRWCSSLVVRLWSSIRSLLSTQLVGRDQADPHGVQRRLGAAGHAELGQNIAHVGFDGLLANPQVAGDLFVG